MYQESFQHNIHDQVDVGSGSTKVQALLSPFEAELLLELLSNTKVDFSERDVDPESLEYRLGLAASGQNGPLSGTTEYYK